MQQNTSHFILTQKQKQLLMRVTLMMYLNQSILRLSQTYRKYLEKCLGWITDSVLSHTINFSKYNLLAGSSYMKLPKEPNYIRNGFINIQNINDNECFD